MKTCPLKKIAYGIDPENNTWECDKEECALWFGAQECCSICAIANALYKEANHE